MTIEMVADQGDVELPPLQRTRVRADRRHGVGQLALGDRPAGKISDRA